MRKLIFYGAAVFLSVSVQARVLNCDLVKNGDNGFETIKSLDVSLDDRPSGSETIKENMSEHNDENYVLDGAKGLLNFSLSARWLKDWSNGSIKFNNMNDTFPQIFVVALFFKKLEDGSYDKSSGIEIFREGAPGLNFAAGSDEERYYLFAPSVSDRKYFVTCRVI